MYDPSKLFIGLADEIVEVFTAPIEFEIDLIGVELIQESKVGEEND